MTRPARSARRRARPASLPPSAALCAARPAVHPAVHPAVPVLAVLLGALLVNGTVALWLWSLGRNALPSGPLQWWSVGSAPADNSQHLADIYSIAHAASGAGLYVFLQRVWSLHPPWQRLLLAIASSGLWEMIENTPWVIALFAGTRWAATYRGDSIANALGDTAFVTLGFLAARLIPAWMVVSAAFFIGGWVLISA